MPATSPGFVMKRAFLGLIAATATIAASHPATCNAALPPVVDGQPLPSLAPMLDRVTPAVVNINSKTRVRVRNPLMEDPFFRQFFGMQNAPRERIEQSLGSGVITDAAKGYVLTNNHVIEGADDIAVTLHDGRTLKGQVVGTDPDTDIAVIKIPAENLAALPLADSSKLRVGDFVVALGNPFGVGQSASSGIVSGLNRTGLGGRGYQNFIQTDASINPGNSGGALVNLRGELVGINSQILSTSGGSNGIGLAIPSDLASDVMHQLIATGAVKHGTLGVQTQDLTAEIAGMLGAEPGQGAAVTRVRADSAAAAAGLKAGDVIVALNGKPIHGDNDLHNAEGLAPIGADIELKLIRDGKPLTLNVRLATESLESADGASLDARLQGAELSDAGERVRREGLNGVSINRVAAASHAANAGLKAGDLIIGINQMDIGGLQDLKLVLARHPRQVLLSVVRGRNAFFVPLQ
jgi:serine protease DegQ